VIVFAQPGALPDSLLEQLIEQVRGLDMDEVRQKLATRSS
jgi:thioredoxin 1